MADLFNKDLSGLPEISTDIFYIAGIKTIVHGLAQLPPSSTSSTVTLLFLLHPRLEVYDYMIPIAKRTLAAHYASSSASKQGLLTVCFDQRNHGPRLVHEPANRAWRNGNPLHAQDMFSVYHGTTADVSILLDYLPAYLFPTTEYTITQSICSGVSLGGHATWLALMHEPRITAGCVIIGSPDYTRVMTHRAEKSRLKTFGPNFIGSSDFPWGLHAVLKKTDPAACIDYSTEKLAEKLGGKKIVSLSGAADKLVPYVCAKPFLEWLKKEGPKKDIQIKDIAYEGVGHDCTEEMVVELINFVTATVDSTVTNSKI